MDQIMKGDYDIVSEPWPQISPAAKDLVRKCLDINSDTRILPIEALKHEWLVKNDAENDISYWVMPALRKNSIHLVKRRSSVASERPPLPIAQNEAVNAKMIYLAEAFKEEEIEEPIDLRIVLKRHLSANLTRHVSGFTDEENENRKSVNHSSMDSPEGASPTSRKSVFARKMTAPPPVLKQTASD